MNRDTSIIQAAVLVLIIAVLGIAIWQKQSPEQTTSTTSRTTVEQEKDTTIATGTDTANASWQIAATTTIPAPQEKADSPHTNLIKQYFMDLANEEYTEACGRMSPAKCTPVREAAVANFSLEHKKLINGYEYTSVKDFWLMSPSGKHVTCVKYSYRYIEDTNPQLISEVLSFYTDTMEDWSLKITDRVCEKKYKEGQGERACPIQAKQFFCVDKIK